MIKNIAIILILFCALVSCGKKGDPKYKDPEKKTQIQNILINKV